MRNYTKLNEVGKTYSEHYKNPEIFSPGDIEKVCAEYLSKERLCYNLNKDRSRVNYINAPCAFDIETSSFYEEGNKRAVMYIWQMCLNGAVIIGRTWEEFVSVISSLSELLELGENKRLLIYVHNLAFEFQWIRKYFEWVSVFATDERKPLKAVTTNGIEFRCSYRLSGYSLAKTCENLLKYKTEKMVGDLDYSLIRHSETPVDAKELKYCINDVIGVCSFIMEEIERNEGKISKIPLTSTGYARNMGRAYCFGNTYATELAYKNFMKNFTIEYDEYKLLNAAYQGGYTHANPKYVKDAIDNMYYQENVRSYDFTSSYPTTLIAFKYPMGKGEFRKGMVSDFEAYSKRYCTAAYITYKNLKLKEAVPSACMPYHKLIHVSRPVIDNGKVVSADYAEIAITNVDFEVYKNYYDYEAEITEFLVYPTGYLPHGFISVLKDLYEKKTSLKGVLGKEEEYQHSKEIFNAFYGMCVTAILREEVKYEEDDWVKDGSEKIDDLTKYNESSKRFTHYSWGVWCSAYARRNLLLSLKVVGKDDFVYCDTDSMKILHAEKYQEFITKYNKWITEQVHKTCSYYGMPLDSFEAKTIKGKIKPIGVWDDEGEYDKFKVLGAKRYMTLKGDVFSLTVSGINKSRAIPHLLKKYDIPYREEKGEFHLTDNIDDIDVIFDFFSNDMTVEENASGKISPQYLDEETTGFVTDYLGNTIIYNEKSSIFMENAAYTLSMDNLYLMFLASL